MRNLRTIIIDFVSVEMSKDKVTYFQEMTYKVKEK